MKWSLLPALISGALSVACTDQSGCEAYVDDWKSRAFNRAITEIERSAVVTGRNFDRSLLRPDCCRVLTRTSNPSLFTLDPSATGTSYGADITWFDDPKRRIGGHHASVLMDACYSVRESYIL